MFKRSLNISRHRNSGHLNCIQKSMFLFYSLIFKKKQNPWQVGIMHLFNCLKLSCISLLFWSRHLDRSVASQAQEIEGSHPTSQLRWGGKLMKNIGGMFLFRQPPNVWGSKVAPFFVNDGFLSGASWQKLHPCASQRYKKSRKNALETLTCVVVRAKGFDM